LPWQRQRPALSTRRNRNPKGDHSHLKAAGGPYANVKLCSLVKVCGLYRRCKPRGSERSRRIAECGRKSFICSKLRCSFGVRQAVKRFSPTTKFFDNQYLPIDSRWLTIVEARMIPTIESVSPSCLYIDTSAWHNYTWDMRIAAKRCLFLASGRLLEGIQRDQERDCQNHLGRDRTDTT
jgi:hypothetical protein